MASRRDKSGPDDIPLKRTALCIAGVTLVSMIVGGIIVAVLDPPRGIQILEMFIPVISTVLGGLVMWAVGEKRSSS